MIDWIMVAILAADLLDYIRIARRLIRAESDAKQMRAVARFVLKLAPGESFEAKVNGIIARIQ